MTDFGTTTIGGAGDDNPANNWVWMKATSTPAGNGTLTSISIHSKIRPGWTTIAPAVTLYSDSAGLPNSRLAAEIQTSSNPAAGYAWLTASGFSISITSGTQYWFGIKAPTYDGLGSAHDFFVAFATNGGLAELQYKAATGTEPALDPLPATVGGGLSNATNDRWSIYGTYTPSGGMPDGSRHMQPMQTLPLGWLI